MSEPKGSYLFILDELSRIIGQIGSEDGNLHGNAEWDAAWERLREAALDVRNKAKHPATLPRPSDVHCHAGGWDVIGKSPGRNGEPGEYRLRDTDTFNPWPDRFNHVANVYTTLDDAVAAAWKLRNDKMRG